MTVRPWLFLVLLTTACHPSLHQGAVGEIEPAASGPTPMPPSSSPSSNSRKASPDLTVAPWLPKGAVTGLLTESTPLSAHGVTLALTVRSHKTQYRGPAAGIWSWELRQGGRKISSGFTGEALLSETVGFGVLAFIASDGEKLRATLVPWAEKPFTEDEASNFAEAEMKRRNIPMPGTSSNSTQQAGVLYKVWRGDKQQVSFSIGMASRRVLKILTDDTPPEDVEENL